MGVYERKRKHGVVYYASFMADGRQMHELVGTNKREAERVYRERVREVERGVYVPSMRTANATVTAWAEQWLRERTNRDRDHDAQRIRDHVLPVIGSLRMHDLKVRDCERLIRTLIAKGLGAKSVRNAWGSTRTMLRDALRQDVISRDPTLIGRKVLPAVKSQRREIYENHEVELLLCDDRVSAEARVWCALAFYLGLRKGEVCGLRWSDWDPESKPLGAMAIARQYDGRPLKTDRERRVPVHPHLAAILTVWRDRESELWHGRRPGKDDPIVPSEGGGHLTESQAYKRFAGACAAVGVRIRSVHSSRHTFITAARRGGAPQDLIEVLTHNAKGTMVDHYTHWEWEPLCKTVQSVSYVAPHDAGSGPSGTPEPAWGFEFRTEGGRVAKHAENADATDRKLPPKPPRKTRGEAPHDPHHATTIERARARLEALSQTVGLTRQEATELALVDAVDTAKRLGAGDHCAHILTHALATAADGGPHG